MWLYLCVVLLFGIPIHFWIFFSNLFLLKFVFNIIIMSTLLQCVFSGKVLSFPSGFVWSAWTVTHVVILVHISSPFLCHPALHNKVLLHFCVHFFHEIKRCLLLGRKVMTNLNSILKSKDFTLPTKVRLVKAMVFPVVIFGCESWTIKKAERRRIGVFELWC